MRADRLPTLLVTVLVVVGSTVGLLAVVPQPAAAASWAIEDVNDDAEGYAVANDLDPDGNPHLVYFSEDGVTYARSDGRGWSNEVVAPGHVSTRAGTLDLAIDRGGVPRVSFHDAEAGTLGFAYDAGASWQAETVDAGTGDVVGQVNSIAVEPSGRPHIAYLASGGARHASTTRSGWRARWLDDDLRVRDEDDGGIAIDVASDGSPHVAYYQRRSRDVRYARRDGGTWFHETAASEDNVGNTLDVVVGADDDAHIAYSEWETGAEGFEAGLHYAHWTGSAWDRSTIEPEDGRWPSIALDAEGSPHVSYMVTHSSSDRELKYAHLTDDGWAVETVAHVTDPTDTSIAVADDGTVHVSYVTAGGTVKHATRLPVAVPVGVCVTCGSGIGTWLAGDEDVMVTVEGDNGVDSYYFLSLDGGEVSEFEQVERADARDVSLRATTDAKTANEVATAEDRLPAVQSAYADGRIEVQPVGIGDTIKFGVVGLGVGVYTAVKGVMGVF